MLMFSFCLQANFYFFTFNLNIFQGLCLCSDVHLPLGAPWLHGGFRGRHLLSGRDTWRWHLESGRFLLFFNFLNIIFRGQFLIAVFWTFSLFSCWRMLEYNPYGLYSNILQQEKRENVQKTAMAIVLKTFEFAPHYIVHCTLYILHGGCTFHCSIPVQSIVLKTFEFTPHYIVYSACGIGDEEIRLNA